MTPPTDESPPLAEFRPGRWFPWFCYANAVAVVLLFIALPLFALTIPECRTTWGYVLSVLGPALGIIGTYLLCWAAVKTKSSRAVVRADRIEFRDAFPAANGTIPMEKIERIERGVDDEIVICLKNGNRFTPNGILFDGRAKRAEFERLVSELSSARPNDLAAGETTAAS